MFNHFTLFKIPEQSRIIDFMRILGHPANENGVCDALCKRAREAFLSGNLQSYISLVEKIKKMRKDQFEMVAEIIKKSTTNEPLSKEERKVIETVTDILAFFDATELDQQPYRHPEYFEAGKTPKDQTTDLTIPLTMSKGLENQGGLKIEKNFSGIYQQKELHAYFQSLMDVVNEKNCSIPISLLIRNVNHAIHIGYDSKKNKWFFTDPNHELPGRYITNIEELVKAIMSAFQSKDVITFSTQVSAATEDKAQLNQLVTAWQQQTVWQEMHTPTEEKAEMLDSNQASWLVTATQISDIDVVTTLLKKTKDPNKKDNRGDTLLCITASTGNDRIAEELLRTPNIDPNLADSDGECPLFIAAHADNLNIVKLLANTKNVDINRQRSDGASALAVASYLGHLEIVKVLLQTKDININLANNNGATPIDLTIGKGHFRIFVELLKAGADPLRCKKYINNPALSPQIKEVLLIAVELNKLIQAIPDKTSDRYQAIQHCYQLCLNAEDPKEAQRIFNNFMILEKCYFIPNQYDPKNNVQRKNSLDLIKKETQIAYKNYHAQQNNSDEVIKDFRHHIAEIGAKIKEDHESLSFQGLGFLKVLGTKSRLAEIISNIPVPESKEVFQDKLIKKY